MSNEPNDRQDQNEGGLFSDDYEAPKRENPYLKKNREKAAAEAAKAEAARAEKAAKEEAKRQRKIKAAARAEADRVARMAGGDMDTPTESVADEPVEGYTHRRTFSDFIFEHVKLITAIVTACLILSLVLITDVISIVENLITESQQADKEYISLNYVEGLTQLSEPVTWGHLTKFRRDTNATKNTLTWTLEVGEERSRYIVKISGTDISHAPTYVRLYDMDTGDFMDINKDDFDKFIAEHS